MGYNNSFNNRQALSYPGPLGALNHQILIKIYEGGEKFMTCQSFYSSLALWLAIK